MSRGLLKLLLLGTFAFWATGTARWAHERIEHHGHDLSSQVDDDDDDQSIAIAAHALAGERSTASSAKDQHSHRPCVLCQTLSAMAAHRSPPPALPQPTTECVATLTARDWTAPALFAQFCPPARGPPTTL